MHDVFVYGTLKQGFANYDEALLGKRFVGRATTIAAWPLVVAGRWFSPVVLPERGRGLRFAGELYRVDEPTLAELDALENVGLEGGYHRRRIAVQSDREGRLFAWCYMKYRAQVGPLHSSPLSDYRDSRYVPRAARRQD